MSDGKFLHQRLLDVEAARSQERTRRIDAEQLLHDLALLTAEQPAEQTLATILQRLCSASDLGAAGLLLDSGQESLPVIATAGDFPERETVPRDSVIEQALSGDGRAFFDSGRVPAWVGDSTQPLHGLASLVMLPVRGAAEPGLLVLGDAAPRRVDRTTVDRLRRMRVLVAQGMIQRDLALAQAERRATEDALRENERFLQTLVSNLPGAVYRSHNDAEWRMLFMSEYCRELFGYSPDEFVTGSVNVVDLVHPEDHAAVRAEVDHCVAQQRPFELVYRAKRRDGGHFWAWELGRGVFDDDGALLALEGFITDITAFKEVEEERSAALARSQRQHAALIELARTAADGEHSRAAALRAVVEAGREALESGRAALWLRDGEDFVLAHGIDERWSDNTEAVGRPIRERDFPDYFRALESARVVAAPAASDDERTRALHSANALPSGVVAVLDAAIRVDGRVVGILCFNARFVREWQDDEIRFAGELADQVAQVLTTADRWAAERALAQERELAQITLQALSEAVIRTDGGNRVRFLNAAAERLTGWSAEDARGRVLADVLQLVLDGSGEAVDWWENGGLERLAALARRDDLALVTADGAHVAVEISGVDRADAPANSDEAAGTVVALSDVSKRRHLTRRMAYQARHDALTGLVNRFEFEQRLQELIADAQAHDSGHALLYIDLDQFKIINDTCGHPAGDQLLCQLSGLLQRAVRESDTLARIGGDEFGVLLWHCDLDAAETVAANIIAAVNGFRFTWDGQPFTVGASIGAVVIDGATEGYASVMQAADTACYAAKEEGRNRVRVFAAEDATLSHRHGQTAWVARLHDALADDRFHLACQEIHPLAEDGRPRLKEVLLRMVDDTGVEILPGSFLPAAERYDLLDRIDRWVIERVLERLAAEPAEPGLRYSINVSGMSLGDPAFNDFVEAAFARHGVDPGRICVEVTETAAVTHLEQTIAFIDRLRALGAHVALDHFGSGMSSFAYLKMLRVDYLKIDAAFVRNLGSDPVDEVMVRSMQELAGALGVRTVAEGIEMPAVLERVRALAIDYAQGYGLHRPERWHSGRAAPDRVAAPR